MDPLKEYTIVRLDPNTDSWHLFPTFVRRVREMMLEMGEPVEIVDQAILTHRQRWVAAPVFTGYFIVLNEERQPFSHLLAEISQHNNKPFMEVIQWKVDKGHNALAAGLTRDLLQELDCWAAGLNNGLPPERHFKSFTMTTERSAKAWLRYLTKAGRVAKHPKSMVECLLGEPL